LSRLGAHRIQKKGAWLDLELEEYPHSFDPFFDTPWKELSDQEKGERMMAVRRML